MRSLPAPDTDKLVGGLNRFGAGCGDCTGAKAPPPIVAIPTNPSNITTATTAETKNRELRDIRLPALARAIGSFSTLLTLLRCRITGIGRRLIVFDAIIAAMWIPHTAAPPQRSQRHDGYGDLCTKILRRHGSIVTGVIDDR